MANEKEISISLVIPAFNEEENIPLLCDKCHQVLSGIGGAYEIIFIDDGSTDGTLDTIKKLAAQTPEVKFLSFSRNFGHQRALRAGLNHAAGECVITMDADLQHPPELILKLIEKWREGFEVVITLRKDPATVSLFKRSTSFLYYSFINLISDFPIEPGSADFRLLDRTVVDKIRGLKETDVFMRGVIPWLGYKTAHVEYQPAARAHGKSKYSLGKMIGLAFTGITSTSIQPLRISIILAFAMGLFALLYAGVAFFSFFLLGETVPGWTSVILAISVIGALQLFVLGVIGEYLGRVLRESLDRPSYIIRETNFGSPDADG